jgi:protein TonB
MQGSVRVSFTILSNGNVGHISVNGPRVFHKSTKKAVQKAFPISVKNIPISLPKAVSFTMHYRLK